jgi:hypothetical protein
MNLTGAQRLACRLHRGEIDDAGGAYIDHLERVAALVEEDGRNERQQMAAWLHGAGRVGLRRAGLVGLRRAGLVARSPRRSSVRITA